MQLIELNKNEFDDYSKGHPLTSFEQSSNWAKVKQLTGWQAHYYGLKDNNKLLGATLLLEKTLARIFKIFYAPHGFLLDYTNKEILATFSKEIVNKIKKLGGFCIKIEPYIDLALLDKDGNKVIDGYDNSYLIKDIEELGYKYLKHKDGSAKTTSIHTMFVLDVEGKSEKELLKNLSSSARLNIRQYKRKGVSVRELKREELKEFKRLMEMTSSRRGFNDRSLEYYESIYDAYHDDGLIEYWCAEVDFDEAIDNYQNIIEEANNNIDKLNEKAKKYGDKFNGQNELEEMKKRIISAEKKINNYQALKDKYGEETIISVNSFLYWGSEEVISLYGGNDTEFFDFGGAYAMYWHGILEALRTNKKRFNFYGIPDNLHDKNDPSYGVYETKRAYNGRVIKLLGEFDYVISPLKYYLYNILLNIYNKSHN